VGGVLNVGTVRWDGLAWATHLRAIGVSVGYSSQLPESFRCKKIPDIAGIFE
jgi:hypothetical protein